MSSLERPLDPTTLLFKPLGVRGAEHPADVLSRYRRAADPAMLCERAPKRLQEVFATICRL